MRARFEFTFHEVAAGFDPNDDGTLALHASLGWEIRGIAVRDSGGLVVALQRPLADEHPLPDPSVLAATLESPLHAPGPGEFDAV
jgi:hypothetical protein